MRQKLGVVVVENETTRAIKQAFETVCFRVMGPDFECQVSSGIDGNHSISPESGHYQARALDFSLYGFSKATGTRITIPVDKRAVIVNECQGLLNNEPSPARYLVILESTHIHIQREKNSL